MSRLSKLKFNIVIADISFGWPTGPGIVKLKNTSEVAFHPVVFFIVLMFMPDLRATDVKTCFTLWPEKVFTFIPLFVCAKLSIYLVFVRKQDGRLPMR